MPEIQYICISDLHFGAYNSLLTHTSDDGKLDARKKSDVLIHLINVMEEIISITNKKRKAKFILNGDIFELALANTNEAVMTFDSFLSLTYTKNRKEIFSDKLIYIPGNHDHHLWETARERQYLEYMLKLEPGAYIELPWHHTKMIKPNPLKSRFITTLMQRHKNLKEGRAMTVYPNLTLVNRETEKYVVISHGHFIENIYYLMSNPCKIFTFNLFLKQLIRLNVKILHGLIFSGLCLEGQEKLGQALESCMICCKMKKH